MSPRSLSALLHSLTEPSAQRPEPERRRARLLAWLHLALMLMCALGLVVVAMFHPDGSLLRTRYGWLIAGLMLLLLAAYGLNRFGRYTASAWLTVAVGVVGPWASAWLDD